MKCPAIIKAGISWASRLWKRHGATIVLVTGTTAVVAGEVFAVKAGTHVEETLVVNERRKAEVENKMKANGYSSEEEYRRDLGRVKVDTAKDFVKLFFPAALLTGSGIGMIFTSHGMMQKSLVVTAAAGAAIQKSLDDYRERVRGMIGDEAENDLYHGVETKEHLEEIQDKSGKTKTVKRTEKIYTGSVSPYLKVFDETNPNWKGREDYDIAFLKQVQCTLTDDLIIRKYLFWNYMLEQLGFEPEKIGQKVGSKLSTDGSTDNYVDFGIFDKNGVVKPWVIKSYRENHCIPLDFNLDGNILDKIDMKDSFAKS